MSEQWNSQNEKELIDRIEKAAREGAREGAKQGSGGFSLLKLIPTILFLCILFAIAGFFIKMRGNIMGLIDRDEPVANRDLTLENHGILGYTAADFQEAILGDSSQLKKLEVYTTTIADLAEITDTGLGNLKIFTKYQYITYHGQASYTVDLSKLNKNSITLDEDKQEVTLTIPHSVLEPINIPSDEIEFGDVKRGILALGKISITPEEIAKVQTEAQKKMEEKLEKEKTIEEADRFAELSVWEIYQPLVTGVASGYSLNIEFEK